MRYADSGCVDGLVTGGKVALNGVTFTALAGTLVSVCVCMLLKGVLSHGTTEEEEKAYFLKTRSARKHRGRINKRKTTRGQDKVCALPSPLPPSFHPSPPPLQVITKALQRQQERKKKATHKATHVRFSDSDQDS